MPHARVVGLTQVVAHDEEVPVGNAPSLHPRTADARELVVRALVHEQAPGLELNEITRPRRDALDVAHAHAGGQHDDVAHLHAPASRTRQQQLAVLQRRMHGASPDADNWRPMSHVSAGARGGARRERPCQELGAHAHGLHLLRT